MNIFYALLFLESIITIMRLAVITNFISQLVKLRFFLACIVLAIFYLYIIILKWIINKNILLMLNKNKTCKKSKENKAIVATT